MGFEASYAAAVINGLLSFLSPCILPMVPFYLSYMAGLSMQELTSENQIAKGARSRLVISAVFFALGVITIFVMLGMLAAGFGRALGEYMDYMSYAAAVILTVFGLHFLGVIRIPFLYREAKIDTSNVKPASYVGSYAIGLAFGFGWTPCAGPFLATMTFIAMQTDSVIEGGKLFFVYGAAMTFPFILVALFSGPFLRWVQRHMKLMKYIEKLMGVMLLIFAALIATGNINRISSWLIDTFPSLLVMIK